MAWHHDPTGSVILLSTSPVHHTGSPAQACLLPLAMRIDTVQLKRSFPLTVLSQAVHDTSPSPFLIEQ